MSKEAIKLALDALKNLLGAVEHNAMCDPVLRYTKRVIAELEEALTKQEQKYRRGDRLVCLETDEFCVIHISGIDRQWVKFPDSHIGVYTNEQIADMFELLAKEQEQKRPQNCGTSYCSCIECVMEQEQGEPVGEILLTNGDYKEVSWKNGKLPPIGAKLYTTLQPAQKPMTDEQIFGLLVRIDEHAVRLPKGLLAFARSIEAAHGIRPSDFKE